MPAEQLALDLAVTTLTEVNAALVPSTARPATRDADDLEPGDHRPLLTATLDGATAVQLYRLLGRVRGGTVELADLHARLDRGLREALPDLAAYRTRADGLLPDEVDLRWAYFHENFVFDTAGQRYVHRASPPGRRALRLGHARDPDLPLHALLRRFREAARLTQVELAARAEVSARCVQRLESGRSGPPRAHTLRQLTAALDLPPDAREALTTAARRVRAPDRVRSPAGAGSPYVDRVPIRPTQPTAARPRYRASATGDVTDRYARPTELDRPPTTASGTYAWLERVATGDVDTAARRYDVCQAWPTGSRWETTVLAREVDELAGAQLVDGLRALRRLERAHVPSGEPVRDGR